MTETITVAADPDALSVSHASNRAVPFEDGVGGGGRGGGETGGGVGSDCYKNKKLIKKKQIDIDLNEYISSIDTETLCHY
jgi:hypothetical protein